MKNLSNELKYTKSHEWIRIDDECRATVGITDHAQSLLGDVVYVELPKLHSDAIAGNAIAVVESVKAASDVYAPLTGKVVETNTAVCENPELINQDAYGKGWLFVLELKNNTSLEGLLSSTDYAKYLAD